MGYTPNTITPPLFHLDTDMMSNLRILLLLWPHDATHKLLCVSCVIELGIDLNKDYGDLTSMCAQLYACHIKILSPQYCHLRGHFTLGE
ncbi:hypothetical protein VIGAN_04300000 [Vigna angularis var. angularis]|uniref:Uncharacterized protein n=1 Tax=Vigna angularis var. angularis TaxID=157739 RepID=A0A0S3RY48_PHAAN|nr:hypothetical protein VIGAN_04300000 [Vigna angularis var. angularis]